jgi:hypothetical protein
MSLRTCADCSTQYAADITVCPHCGSSDTVKEGIVTKRLPLFVTVSCPECGNGPWTFRLDQKTSGLVEIPTLACASCGSRVPVTWPPEEEPMSPKISVHSGATNARVADVSPAADASQPQDVAEDVLGPQLSEEPQEQAEESAAEELTAVADYDGMTLAELREAANNRDLPSYGNKAQIIERLRDADGASEGA